jgi:4-hydroxy-3-polyprenylbenzoate decarboxylase
MASRYRDLREFIAGLEERGELRRIRAEVDPYLEITEIADRTLRAGGPALLFENPRGSRHPLLATCSAPSSAWPWAWARRTSKPCARSAAARLPAPAGSAEGPARCLGQGTAAEEGAGHGPEAGTQPARRTSACTRAMTWTCAPCRYRHCWPGDAAPLITWPLVITRGPEQGAAEPRHLPHAGARTQPR